jgi:MarR family transcriptional regulator, organic hydroperoxide resistance regulator
MPANRIPADAQDAALRLDNQLCFAMYSASLAMTKLYKPLLETLDLTYPQYLAMLALWEQDGVSVSALGERLFLDSGTLTPLLKRMEEKGLLRRQRSAQDERRVEVFLSLQGTDLKSQAARIPACVIAATHCALPDLVALTRQVQVLRKQLTEPLPLNTP